MESSTGSAADKKRNKLGYHRTSVACVHCRRRKIRCLLAPEDSQGRCENCIRLKKECHFYPVDQQPAVDKRGRPISKSETTGSDASLTTTPPLLSGGTVMEQKESYFQYQSLAMAPGQDISAFKSGAYPGARVAAYTPDPMAVPELGSVPNPNQPVPPWNEPIYEHQVPGIALGPSSSMVQPGVVPLAPKGLMTGAPDPGEMLPMNMAGAAGFCEPHDVPVAWGAQISRSLSLSTRPGVPSPITQPYPSQFHPSQPINTEFKRRMTTPANAYPTTLGGHTHAIPQMSGAPVPVSFDESQIPFTTYAIPGVVPETIRHPGQVIMGTAADPMPFPEWYSPGSLQAQQQQQQAFIPDHQNLMHPPPT